MRSMSLKFAGRDVAIYGGPYVERPVHMTGVKLAVEIDRPCDINLPIVDFNVPDVRQAKRAVLASIGRLAKGETLYAGCWGGLGRTGLFLALMAKTAGVPDPVAYVRAAYNPHAVETDEQKQYVADFPVFWLSWAYRIASQTAKVHLPSQPNKPKP